MTTLQSLSDDLAAAVSVTAPALVSVHARRRIPSSGILWQPDVVVTAHHTIHRDDGIVVSLHDGTKVNATLAGRDPTTDIAVLRLAQPAAVSAVIATSDVLVGQIVLALGRPGASVTAAMGVVRAVGGEWRTWCGGRIDKLLQLDIAVYDGFSGGALVNAAGQVIGLNSSGLSRSSAMSIPFSTVARVAQQLLDGGHVKQGFLGVGLQPVRIPTPLAAALGLDQSGGLMVVSLDDDGPAGAAGILLGDIVVSLDGHAVTDPNDVLAQLTGDRIGREAHLRIIRAGQVKDVPVVIGQKTSTNKKR